MNAKFLLALTSHGNAPYLMAARLAQSLGNLPVIIPDYYGASQHRILREEIPNCAATVYLSRQLGDLFRPLLLDKTNSHLFADFAFKLGGSSKPSRIDLIESELQTILHEGIAVSNFDQSSTFQVNSDQIGLILNSALPLRTNGIPQIYFFTASLARIYGQAPESGNEQSLEKQTGLSHAWQRTEAEALVRFIPRIHALAHQGPVTNDVIQTPPLAYVRPHVSLLPRDSFLLVPSGTGTDQKKLDLIAKTIPSKFQAVEMSSAGFARAGLAEANSAGRAAIYGDRKVKAVISRGGWGTTWECLQNGLPLGLVRTTYQEDPEMGHSQITLSKLGLGLILDGDVKPLLQDDVLESIRARVTEQQNQDILLFGQDASNGLNFIANYLLKHFPNLFEAVSVEYSLDQENDNG